MEFHYDLLEETIKEIKDMRFFKETIEVNDDEYEIIHDYDEAVENAFSRPYDYGEFGLTWCDILEENMADVRGVIYQSENYAELSKKLRELEIPELEEIEFTIDDDSVQEEIVWEIECCAQSRLVCGKENAFFESLFRAYKLGGWPCGWNDGKIIVYVPEKG